MKAFVWRWATGMALVLAVVSGALGGANKTPNAHAGRTSGVREAFEALDDDARTFQQIVGTLADPFFEGRSPDVRGNWFAAEYVKFYFERAGLRPGFTMPDQPAVSDWFQSFDVPGEVQVATALATLEGFEGAALDLRHERDFNPMGLSGNGSAQGPLVFVGYSIAGGPEGFSSYKAGDDLTGKIALVLRFEPVNERGESRWTTYDGWSRHASLMEKVGEAVTRGAAGVVLINPPGVRDPRSKVLETTAATRIGKAVGVPVVMLSNEAAARVLSAAAPGKSLDSLRELADAGGHGAIPVGEASSMRLSVQMQRALMSTRNIAGLLPGRGELASQYVVIGAHYDHVGYGYVGGSNPSDQGTLHPGADDNASGVAGLLMLASRLGKTYAAMHEGDQARSILFLAFSAEEMGLLGSEQFVRAGVLRADQVEAMLNMDMIGRMQDQRVEVSGLGTAKEMAQIMAPVFQASGLDVKDSASGMGPSDHATFHRAGVPVLHVFTGVHADYHRPGDLAYKINAPGGVRIVGLVHEAALALATRAERLTPQETKGPQMARGRAKVRLGIMPGDYSGVEPGVLVGDVYEGTSAGKAGVRKGDRIIRWGGEELADAGSMMQRLVDASPGDVVEIVVVRDGAEVTIPVTLLAKDGQ